MLVALCALSLARECCSQRGLCRFCWGLAEALSVCRGHLVVTLSLSCRCLAVVLPLPCRCAAVALLLPCCRPVVASLWPGPALYPQHLIGGDSVSVGR